MKKTIGETLKTKRVELKIPPEQVERDVAIRKEQLDWIEGNLFRQFDAHVYAKGFIKSYAKYLGVTYEPLLAIYRRDFENTDIFRENIKKKEELEKKSRVPFLKRINPLRIFTKKRLAFLFIFIIVTSALVGAGHILRLTFQQPVLKIITPFEIGANYKGKFEITDREIILKGQTSENTIIKINKNPISLEPDFTFTTDSIIPTIDGETILIEASNSLGVTSSIEITIVKRKEEIKELKMTIFAKVTNQKITIKADGIIRYNSIPNLSERLTIRAKRKIEIITQFPENFEIKINDIAYNLADGTIFENKIVEIIQKSK